MFALACKTLKSAKTVYPTIELILISTYPCTSCTSQVLLKLMVWLAFTAPMYTYVKSTMHCNHYKSHY